MLPILASSFFVVALLYSSVGHGGGIFLSPLLLFLGWAEVSTQLPSRVLLFC